MKNNYYLLFLILVLCFPYVLSAQEYKLTTYFQEDGLPNDLVKSLAMDKNGFVWVATDDGIVKMQGRNFEEVITPSTISGNFKEMLYTSEFGMLASADGGVLCISENSQGIFSESIGNYLGNVEFPKVFYPKTLYKSTDSSLWISSNQSIVQVLSDTVYYYRQHEKNYTDHFSRATQFFEVAGSVYSISQVGIVNCFDNALNEFVEQHQINEIGKIFDVEQVTNDEILLGGESGILHLGFDTGGQIVSSSLVDFSFSVSKIKKICDTTYVIGTWSKGAYFLNLKNGGFELTQIEQTEEATVNDILIDNNNNIWLATDIGVQLLRSVEFSSAYSDITKGYIQDVQLAADDKLYFTDGNNVYQGQHNLSELKTWYTPIKGLVLRLLVVPSGVWMSTNLGELIFKSNSGKVVVNDFSEQGKGIYNLVADKEENIWFVHDRSKQTVLRIDKNGKVEDFTPKAQNGNLMRGLSVDSNGIVYVFGSSKTNYIYKFDVDENKFINISVPITQHLQKVFGVVDVKKSTDGRMYLATDEGVWIIEHGTIRQLDLGALSNEMVSSINLDHFGRLWFANSNGLIFHNNNEYTIFNNSDGLPSKTGTYRTLEITNEGILWIGTISGLAVGQIKNTNHHTAAPIISSFKKSGESVDFGSISKFSSSEYLSFKYASPNYPLKHVQYQYKLLSTHSWMDIKRNHSELIFNSLDPGNYKLQLRAKSKGFSSWSEPFVYDFKVHKVWYKKTGSIIAFYLFLFVSVFLYIYYLRWKNERERNRLEMVIDERTKSLQENNEELVQLNNHLEKARVEAEQAINSKDKFFSILAHDLKSPFNALIGFSDLLANNRNDLPEETLQQVFDELLSTSENTYKLLQNLLDWARSQTGAMIINSEYLNLNDIVSEVMLTVKPLAKSKLINIEVDIEPGLIVFADFYIVSTIIRNLLNNAIKFSNIEKDIVINACKVGANSQIKVIDKGTGISDEKIEVLFDIDSNTSTEGTNREKGTGLGLVLCKELVDRSNGSIKVSSKVGVGSEFTVTLPYIEVE